MNLFRNRPLSANFTVLAISLALTVQCAPVFAQLGGLDAEFAGAGARPLAMGGSFLALADDSTAAEFNPAGIRILRRPELAWQVTRTYDRRDEFLRDTAVRMQEPLYTRDGNIWSTPSFISYVHPGQEYTWAVSQLTTIDSTHRFDDPFALRSFVSKTEVSNHSYGFTFATDIKPRLHFGTTLRLNRFDWEFMDTFDGRQELSDWSPNINLGLLWRATKDWSFGTVFKSSQKVAGDTPGGEVSTKLPETWGIGLAYHPDDKLRIVADIDYINWSEFDSIPDDGFVRNDVTRYHLGGEYMLDVNDDRAWFLRCGYMREESNALFYPELTDEPGAGLFVRSFPEEDPLNHLTIGVGLAKEQYQLDLAVDHVLDGATTLILAMIHYF